MLTAGALCLVAILVDHQLRFDALDAHRVAEIEIALVIYGTTCALVSATRRGLTAGDKAAITGCLLVFGLTTFIALFMPRVIHN